MLAPDEGHISLRFDPYLALHWAREVPEEDTLMKGNDNDDVIRQHSLIAYFEDMISAPE